MHLRPDHAVRDLPTLHAFIRAHPLGVLTTSLPSTNFPTLQCSHIPWVLDADNPETETETEASETETSEKTLNASTTITTGTTHKPSSSRSRSRLGVLRGHIARANPQTTAMIEAVRDVNPTTTSAEEACSNSAGGSTEQSSGPGHLPGEVLIIFASPVDHYISPHFYTTTKPATGKVAPTWNYAAVQVYGRMSVYHDSRQEETGNFLHRQLGDLARLGEEGVMGFSTHESECENGTGSGTVGDIGSNGSGAKPNPWKIEDAPDRYIALLKKNIVGMEVEITRVEGRFKVSQERPVGDREGVVDGLGRMGGRVARHMAQFVREGGVV